MTTVRELVLAELYARLQTVTGATAYRTRLSAAARDEGVVIVMRPESEEIDDRGRAPPGVVMRSVVVVVAVIAHGGLAASGADVVADVVADDVVARVHAALMGAADTTLGGRCAAIMERGTRWDLDLANGTACAVEIRYQIRYATRVNDLTSQA